MSEEKKDLNIEAQIADFIEHPDNYTLEEANALYREWIEFEDKIEADAKAHAEKVKVANILAKSVNKHYGEPALDKIKEGVSDFIIDVKARSINFKDKIKKKIKRN